MKANYTKNTNETRVKRIYKRTIALELRKKGFKIVGVEPNPDKPYFDVYIFEDTAEFQKGLTEVLTS